MATLTLLNPGPPPLSHADRQPVPFRGIVTDPAEALQVGLTQGILALVQNMRSSGSSLQARNGGLSLIPIPPSGTSAYVDHFPVILNGVTSIVAGFYDGTNTRLYITSNPITSSSAYTEITELVGQDGLTRFSGLSPGLAFAVVKSPRSLMNAFNGTPRDVLVISDGSTVRVYDPGGSATNLLWQHMTPLYPTGADGFNQTATWKNFVQVAGGSPTYPSPGGVVNQSRYKFSDTTVAPYTSANKAILLTMTSAAQTGDQAQVVLVNAFTPKKQLPLVFECDTPASFQDLIQNTSIQLGTGASIPITSAVYTTGTPGFVTVTTGVVHGLSTGNTITIIGNKNATGTWQITVTSTTTFTFVATFPVAVVSGGTVYVPGGAHRPAVPKPISTVAGHGATPGTPVAVETSVVHTLTTGQQVTITGNTVANGVWVVTVVDTTHFTLNGSASPGGSAAGGSIVFETNVFDSTSTNPKITSPVEFRVIGNNASVAVQYEVVLDLTSFSASQLASITFIQFTRLANASFSANTKILNIASAGAWAGSTGFAIAYSSSFSHAESPGFVPQISTSAAGLVTGGETTDVLSGFGGPTQVTNTGNVVTLDVGGDTILQATSGSTTTVVVSSAPFTASAFVGKYLSILYGLGAGQAPRLISANTTSTITVPAGTATDSTSVFFVSDSGTLVTGAPQLPIPTSAVFYDYKLAVKNPWVQSNVGTPGFVGGLAGIPDAVAFYVTPAGSRDNDQPGTYQYLCTRALVSPTANYQSFGPGWTYNFSTDPAILATSEAEMAPLDVTSLNSLRLLPTALNQGVPAFTQAWAAFKRLFILGPLQDSVARTGACWFSMDSFPFRWQEFPLARNPNPDGSPAIDDTLGGSATFDAGQVGERAQAIIGNAAEQGISSVYVHTGHAFYRMGNPTTNGSSQTATALSSPAPVSGHGTNSPDSVVENMGMIYWLDQYSHFVRYTPSYANQFQFQSGIEDLTTRKVGDRFANLPAGQLANVTATSVGFLIYVAYCPVGQMTNTRCLVFNSLPQNQFWVSDDLLPASWDFSRIRRLYDPSLTGSGQRLMGMTSTGKLFAYEESPSSDFGTGLIACRITTGWYAPGAQFYFGQTRFMGQAEVGVLAITRTYIESGDAWVSTLPLTDPRNPTFAYINGYDALRPADPVTGRPQLGWRGFMDYAWSSTPGHRLDGLFQDVTIDQPVASGVR